MKGMKNVKRFLILPIILSFCLVGIANASDIAFYIGQPNPDGWYNIPTMFDDVDTMIAEIGSMFDDVQQFDDDHLDDFGAWADANTDDGEFDIIWLNGCTPSCLYQFPNVDADGSRAEEWLDGGDMLINVADWFAYCSYEGGARKADNGGTGAANILDLSAGIIVSADNTKLKVTPTGEKYMPSLGNSCITFRPVVLSQVTGDWELAAAFATSGGDDDPDEMYADPVVIHNTKTDGYVAFINQAAGSGPPSWLDDRGLSCAEFIGNWVGEVIGLKAVEPADKLSTTWGRIKCAK